MSQKERRRHRRFNTKLRGRYMLADRREFACTIVDVSLGGVALTGSERGAIGEPVIVYIDKLGRVEGNIVRHLPDGFAVRLTITTRATEKFAHRLHAVATRRRESSELRKEPRIPVDSPIPTSLSATADAECEVIDLSLSGADVKITERPPIGALVRLGRLHGRVVRHSGSGVAIEFVDLSETAAPTLTDRFTEVVVSGSAH